MVDANFFYHQKKRKVKLDKVREGLRPITLHFRGKKGFCRPKTKKENNLSHLLSDLSDILRGHFDAKTGGTTLPGAKVSRQRPVCRGCCCHLRKTKIAILKKKCLYGLGTYCVC